MRTGWLLHACIVGGRGTMNTHRWWSNCGMVFAAILLSACTQGQIEQVLQNKTQDMISGPCTPAGVSSAAVPEVCINVTEVRLLDHDMQANVSLTLVNRTGRKIYITRSGPVYLTDGSGTKWDGVSATGIARDYQDPLPIDPNVEAQASILFQRSGQAPSDLIFSMHGAIRVLKVDSRGEPIPPNVQSGVIRGYNLSGIRIAQKAPQSSGPAN